MKLHEGRCSNPHHCTRTHAYKCFVDGTWFKTDGTTFVDTDRTIYVFAFWPVCSLACWNAMQAGVKGQPWIQVDERASWDRSIQSWQEAEDRFPNPAVHDDFGNLMKQTKELE